MRLKGAFLTLTNRCNLNCKYCYQNSHPKINIRKELKKRDWIKIINELNKLNVDKINIVGGEPFLLKELFNILDHILGINKNIKIKIFTNGILLNTNKIKKIRKYNLTLSFNLNSHKKQIHDFYASKGNWKKIIKNIKKCSKINFEISTPLTKRNFDCLEGFVKFCEKLGAKRIRFVPLIILKDKKGLKKEQATKEMISDFKKKIENFEGIELTFGCRTCEGGTSYLTIQANGDITPCTLNRSCILGNIKRDSIKEILKRSKSLKFKSCGDQLSWSCLDHSQKL